MTLLFTAVLILLLLIFVYWSGRKRRRLLAAVEVVALPDVYASRLDNRREIWVYLPPGYRQDTSRSYPVLYLNDGQDREILGLRETLARLMASGRIEPVIVVAIPTNADRLHEYGTAVAMNQQKLGARAADYAHFIVEELMPLVDETFRTKPGAIIAGASLGGLSAFDIAWANPDRFAAVGVMSGSFWWRAREDEQSVEPGRRIAHSLVRGAGAAPPFRLWFQAGTRDEVCDRDGDGVIDAIQDTQELLDELSAAGCAPEQLAYVEVKGGRHDYETWSRVLPRFLEWALRPGQARRRA